MNIVDMMVNMVGRRLDSRFSLLGGRMASARYRWTDQLHSGLIQKTLSQRCRHSSLALLCSIMQHEHFSCTDFLPQTKNKTTTYHHYVTNSQMAAHVLDLHLEGLLGPLAGALEGHVLEEMGRAVVGGRLVARSGIDPDSDRGGLGSGDGLGRDAEAGVERGDVG